ncbi:MAG: PhoH family protein [Proteobacteria bacterium]|nr:PhoH family protein [Pseudomonadota bacterium]
MARTEIEFSSMPHAQLLFGERQRNLRYLEDALGVEILASGNGVRVAGSSASVGLAERVLVSLYEESKSNREIEVVDVAAYLERMKSGGNEGTSEPRGKDSLFTTSDGTVIAAKTANQRLYVEAMRRDDVVFGVGPAGTGKTYLAMAMAVDALMRKKVKRIVLVRPAVEAGERLGFLPGDMAEKVNPYLRPLYDALYDMVDVDRVQRWMSQGAIEVAPLAFMRGRTLNSAFVILDEAQNTTQEQMKMFLTRLGFGSKVVVTGDLTQTDLPPEVRSGLNQAVEILTQVEGLSIIRLTDRDIVRHPMVQKIVLAYENSGDMKR